MSGYTGRNRPAAGGGPSGVQRSYASNLQEHDSLFNSYEHLQGLPRGDSAITMLRKIASLVKPIMRKRGWKVQVLAEFLPQESNLLGLNINRGYKICIRLRYHNNPDLFLPLEQCVDTMLHELSHIIWGDHDGNFHRLWDELRDEWETLTRKGYTGEGFLSKGHQLGGRAPPPHEMRRLARANAEKRQQQNKLTKGSGQKLGGTPLHLQGHDVRQVIVDQVTRRNTINKGCANGRKDSVKLSDQARSNSVKTVAEHDDADSRAIAQALYELMEEEEDRKLKGTFSAAPTDGGLAWHPENGLYNPSRERPRSSSRGPQNASEEEQLKWAMRESMQALPEHGPRPPRQNGPQEADTMAYPMPADTRPSPISATSQPRNFRESIMSPVSPLTDEPRPAFFADRQDQPAVKRRKPDQLDASNAPRAIGPVSPASITSPVVGIDISDPFDPHAGTPVQWTCEICTCINPMQYLACDACGCERPGSLAIPAREPRESRPPRPRPLSSPPAAPAEGRHASAGWLCTRCGTFMEHLYWTCSSCGKMKESS